MRKVTALASFLVVAAGTAAVGATVPTQMRGSDTLFEIFGNQTTDTPAGTPTTWGGIIKNCPGATFGGTTINYIGTGSGNGENEIRRPPASLTQRVAPMSKALGVGICKTNETTPVDHPNVSKAEGIAFALDGVSISVAGDFGAACDLPNGSTGSPCGAGEACVDIDSGLTGGDSNGDVCASGAAKCAPSVDDCNRTTQLNTGLNFSHDVPLSDLNGYGGLQCKPATYTNDFSGATPVLSAVEKSTVTVPGCDNANSVYHVQNWKDVLRILFTGLPVGTLVSGGADIGKTITARDCNSDLRWSLANNYAKLFQTDCAGDADGTGTGCSQIKHAFRRDEFSGTTDVFLATLGMDGIDVTKADKADGTAAGSADLALGDTYKHSRSFFCNVRRNEDTWLMASPIPNSPGSLPAVLSPIDARLGGVSSVTKSFSPPYNRNEALGTPAKVYTTRPYFPEYQDADPIQRACDGSNAGTGPSPFVGPPDPNAKAEQVCGARGSLGLVLPVSIPAGKSGTTDITAALRYPTDMCSFGKFELRVGPVDSAGKCEFCPNGDKCSAGFLCYYPLSTAGVSTCMNSATNLPPIIFDNQHNVSALPGGTTSPFKADGRVYNLYLHNGGTLQDDSLRVNRTNETNQVQQVGAFYRIHQSRTLISTPSTGPCTQDDDTQQIACLVNASKCSIGYQGKEGPSLQVGAFAAKVNALESTTACVREILNNLPAGDFGDAAKNYPMARKLFLNTEAGFENVNASDVTKLDPSEEGLAKCTAAIADGRVSAFGFVTLPSDQKNPLLRRPFCQDFNEKSTCSGNASPPSTDVNACINNQSGIPSNGRICSTAVTGGVAGGAPVQGTCVTGELCDDIGGPADVPGTPAPDGIGDVCHTACDTTAGTPCPAGSTGTTCVVYSGTSGVCR